MSLPILSIKGVSKFYTHKTALDQVSLDIPKGSIFGLLGPNGAGKTSLLRIINQITMPDSGEVFLDGKKLMPDDVQYIGYLPEERGLYKSMKVGEQCLYLAQLKGLSHQEAKKQLKYWFEKLGIEGWWDKKIQELSKGMAQKIQFVVTVLHQPKLLILDEPFSGFDPVNANLIKDEIIELNKNGTSVIFSTHRMESVEQLCDYMAIIHESKLVLNGKIDDIKAQYANGKVIVTCDQSIQLDPNTYAIHQHSINSKGQKVYTIQTLTGNNNALISEVIKQAQLLSFTPVTPSILDIFIQLVTSNNNA